MDIAFNSAINKMQDIYIEKKQIIKRLYPDDIENSEDKVVLEKSLNTAKDVASVMLGINIVYFTIKIILALKKKK